MIRWLANSARFLLEIGLLLGILMLVYWWNPMGIFGGKLKLQPTATLSVQVRDLGELVTAEYYGEVISTIEEAQVDKLEEPQLLQHASAVIDEITEMLEYLRTFQRMDAAHQSLVLQGEEARLSRRDRRRLISDEVSRTNILDRLRFHGEWEVFEIMPLQGDVLGYLFERSNRRTRNIRSNLNESQIRDLLFGLFSRPQDLGIFWREDEFMAAYYQRKMDQLPRNEQRKRLAMIGRGTVKAGFDLSEVTQNMFYINEASKELHFFGLAPKILDADINPWFIPEKGVAGFDILTYNGRVNFKDAKKVKQYAVQKLETSAQRANILESAEAFGGESLKRLFSLMTGKEIESVFFHHDRIVQLSQQIMKDRFINYEEAVLFERALTSELTTIDSLQNSKENRFNNQQLANQKWSVLRQIVRDMQQFAFENDDCRYGYFSTWAYEMAYKGLLDHPEKEAITVLRRGVGDQSVLTDSAFLLWAGADTMQLQEHYNQAVTFLIASQVPVGTAKELVFPANAIDRNKIDSLRATLASFSGENAIFRYVSTTPSDSLFLTHALFPFRYDPTEWNRLMNQRFTRSSITSLADIQPNAKTNSFSVYSSVDLTDVKVLGTDFTKLVNPILLRQLEALNAFCLSESICIIQQAAYFDPKPQSHPLPEGFSPEQRVELASFIERLIRGQEIETRKGPFERANQWIWRRWDDARIPSKGVVNPLGR
jgi:hypothetical protein